MDPFQQPAASSSAPPPPAPPAPASQGAESHHTQEDASSYSSYFPVYEQPVAPPPPPAATAFQPGPPPPNAEAGPSTAAAVLPVRPLKGPGSRGGRGGSGRGRGQRGGGSGRSSAVDSEYAINRPVRTRRPVARSGVGASDEEEDDDDDFIYNGGGGASHHAQSHHSHHRAGGPDLSGKKIKLNFKQSNGRATVGVSGGSGGGRSYNSFLGVYDRELDTDEEEIEFEEQFILRMPEGEPSEKLREMVKEKGAKKGLEDVWFKFKDSRRAVFKLSNQLYSAKLVDLPSIIESQKTLDGKQMFKAADISQMLVVSNPISDESQVTAGDGGQGKLNIEDYIWPHGITPPLRHVRKRRYRKRISRRTIEIVEQEVERMLEQDQRADKVTYDIIEDADPDASDSEFLTPKGTPAALPHGSEFGDGSQMGDGATPRNGNGSDDDDDMADNLLRELEKGDEDEDEDEPKGDDDEEEDDDDDDDDEDDDRDDEEGSEADSEDEEAVEIAQRQKLLNEEIRDLEAAVGRKRGEISSSSNPIIKKRFEDALKKLQADLDSKLSARASVTKEKEKRKREDEEEKERELGLKESAQGEADRLKNVAAIIAASTASSSSSSVPGTGQPQPQAFQGGLVVPPLPPLPSLASSSARPLTLNFNNNNNNTSSTSSTANRPPQAMLPPPPSFLQHSTNIANRQPSSLSLSHLPIPPAPVMPQATPGNQDMEALLAAGMEEDSEEEEEGEGGGSSQVGGDGEEEEEDLFGDDDDDEEEEDDMVEMDVS